MMVGNSTPRDWTLGTGVFPSGGVITITTDPNRNSIFIQNQDKYLVSIALPAAIPNTGTADTGGVGDTPTTATVIVAPASGTGAAGGQQQFAFTGLMTTGAFTVTGTAGAKVCVLTN